MIARSVSLALVLVGSALQTSQAEPCPPRAELGGDAEAVAKVAVELARLGVDSSTDPSARTATKCAVIVAAVELDRNGAIAVAVRDASRRSEGRVVSDAALAAAWIDSWLRDDFEAPAPEPVPVRAPGGTDALAAAETPLLDRFSLAALFLQTWSENNTSSSGGIVSACALVGGLCVGARVSYSHHSVASNLETVDKRDLSLLATVRYAQDLGRMSLAPELGFGIGQLATSHVDSCQVMPEQTCDPTDATCTTPPEPCADMGQAMERADAGNRVTATTYTPRLSAALRIAIPLFDHVWLDGFAGATLAPLRHADEYDLGSEDPGATNPSLVRSSIPGDPLFALQLGIGLRLGAR